MTNIKNFHTQEISSLSGKIIAPCPRLGEREDAPGLQGAEGTFDIIPALCYVARQTRRRDNGEEAVKSSGISDTLQGWFRLSRPPFHTVGILPFLLGTALAWRLGGVFSPPVFLLGVLAVVLIMLSTYHAGEYADVREDEISGRLGRSNFAGGSGVVQAGLLSPRVPLWTSIIAILLAGIIGIILQYGYRTGSCTLLLGLAGAFPGFFYSARPVRLVERGIGEAFIGFCYGWLPVAAAFYIQTGHIDPVIHWIGLSIGFTIFNVIFLNEYPDYPADKAVGKRNMLFRLGPEKGRFVYLMVSLLAWVFAFASVYAGVPGKFLAVYVPIMALSAVLAVFMLRGKYRDRSTLERLCGLTIAVNLGTTACYLFAYL
jgi:1,4-dihydroxy-2-naphthoate polyprenyltransferase